MNPKTRKKPEKQKPAEKFGEKLADLRRKMGLTQQQMADKLQANRSQVAAWEGGSEMPSDGRLIQLGNIAQDPSAKWWLWKCAGLDESVVRSIVAEQSKDLGRFAEASRALAVPLVDQWPSPIDRPANTVILPADYFRKADFIVAAKIHDRGFPSPFGEGDLAVVDTSQRSPFELTGRLALVAFDPFPEGFELNSFSSMQAVVRRGRIPVLAKSEEEEYEPQPQAERAYQHALRAGYLAGWVQLRFANPQSGPGKRPKDNPWRLVLQLNSKAPYQGDVVELIGWQTDGPPADERWAPSAILLPRDRQIVGAIVGWIGAEFARKQAKGAEVGETE